MQFWYEQSELYRQTYQNCIWKQLFVKRGNGMHSFLRAIGFGKLIKESEIEKLLEEVYREFENRDVAKIGDGAFVEMEKEFAPDMGIKLCGVLDADGFHRQHYFPYYKGSRITTEEEVVIERKVNGDSFAGVCDDGRVGVSLIFYLQNTANYYRENIFGQIFGRKTSTIFSGLACGGMILLSGPGYKKNPEPNQSNAVNIRKRSQLMSAAKNGAPEAMESLTIEDMDIYSMVSRRIDHEDVYTIVETYMMPYGIECDQYQIMGNILRCTKVRNKDTNEEVYQMTLDCNGLIFDICINRMDLMGDPDVGRRFKGVIWLQGKVNFE